MFNTCRETTGCYGDVNVDSYPQNVEDSEKVSNSGPAWNMHASGPTVHGAHHGNHPGHSSHSPAPAAPAAPAAPTHYHSAFHHHAANPAVDSYGYSLAQAPLKENDAIAGKDVIRSSPPPAGVATATWQNNRSRSRYPSAVAGGAFLPYPTQLNHYDGPPLEAGPHGMGHSHMLSRKQSWPGENPFTTMPPGGQYQRDPTSAMYAENIRGNVAGGIIRHTTSVSGMEARNPPSQQHQAVPHHLHHQQQSLLHQQQQQQHSAPHHQLLCQLVQKEREAHRLPGYQDRHSVVRSRISGYHEPLFPQHQHLQYCGSQDVLRKVPLPVPMDGDRRSAFTARQTSAYTHGPSQWNKSAVPFMPPFHTQQVLAPHRGGGSAFQPCNKVGEHEAYPPESLIWSKSGQAGPDYGGHMQGPGQAAWMHDAQSQMFHSRQMNKPGLINNGSNVLGLDAVQMGGHAAMHPSGGRQAGNVPKGAHVPIAYQQQHLHLHNPHLRSQMMHQPQAPPQHALQQQPMMQQHQSSPLSNSQHSPMVTSPHDMQSPQMSNSCSQQPSLQQAQQQNDSQLVCNEGDGKESRGNIRSLRNCLDVRQFIENWDEDTEVGTPRPCIDEAEAGDNVEQPLVTTEEALIVLDCRSLRREEAANLLNMYSVPEAEGLLACSGEGMFSTATDTVAQSALQNLLDSVTSSGSNSTTIATPMASPTGQVGGRSLDMLLNAALPTPPASQEHNIAQTNLPLSTPVAVVSLNSPISPHLGDTIRQPKMDETGFGVMSPTSPAASVKFTCATVHTPFVKFPSADDPPSVIQSSRDHMGFSAAHQFTSDRPEVNVMSPSASKAVDLPPVPVPPLHVDTQPSAAETDILPSPALSDASTESKMASLRAFRKQKAHSPDHMSEVHDSLDSNSHDTSDVHPRSSRTSSLMESDDAVDRSQWAFAQITKTSRTPSHEDFRANNGPSIIKVNQNWETADNVQDLHNFKLKPFSSSNHAMVDKSTAPLNCSLETQKSDSSKFDKSTSPTIFLTNKDTQTEESRQDRKRVDTCAFNETFAQTSVHCIQDEIQSDTFAQTSVRCQQNPVGCQQDEIHHESFAQTSLLSLSEEIENYTAEETSCQAPNEKLPLNSTDLLRVSSFKLGAPTSSLAESLSKQTEIVTGFLSGPTHPQQLDIGNEAEELPSLDEAGAEVINTSESNAGCGTSDLLPTDLEKRQVPSKVLENEVQFREDECRTENSSTSVAKLLSPVKPDLDDCIKVSLPECTKFNKQLEDLKTNEDVTSNKPCALSCSNEKDDKLASSSDEAISKEDSDGDERNRSVGTGIDEELIKNEFCPQYLSRIVDSSPGNIPKILLSRLKEKSSKKNGVIKRLPSIRLTRVCSPMSSSLSDPEYVCSVSDTEPGTPSRLDGSTMDSVFSDQASNDHRRPPTLHRKNKRVKHCDAEVQSSPLSSINVRPAEDHEDDNSINRKESNPSTDMPSENVIASSAANSLHISTSDNRNNHCSDMAERRSPHEERSIEVQTEGHISSGAGLKSSDDSVLNIPQSDSLNEIERSTENVSPRFSTSTSQEFISTEHQETGLTEKLPADKCSSPIGSKSIPQLPTDPQMAFNSKALDQLGKEKVLLVPEENELAIDLSLQKIENRRTTVEDVSDLNILTSRQSNSPVVRQCGPKLDFPVPKEMSPNARCGGIEKLVILKSCGGSSSNSVEYYKVDEIVSEKDKLIDETMSCDEKLKQLKELQNVNQVETETSLFTPDLSDLTIGDLEENDSLSEETGLHSSAKSLTEDVFLSQRILCKRSSIDICENDIGRSIVNLKASSQEFFETGNSFVETCSPLAEKNILQENIFKSDPKVEDEVVSAGNSSMSPVVEVASSQRIVLFPSNNRKDLMPIGAGTSGTSERLPATESTELTPEENLTNSVPEITTFSEPVEYSDLFGVKGNETKCDMSDVVVTNPSSREESPQTTPKSSYGVNVQKGSETESVLSSEIPENSNVYSSSLLLDPHSQMQPIVSGENLPQAGCEENCSSASPSCSSKPHESPIDCVGQNSSTGTNVDDTSPNAHCSDANLDEKDETLLEFDSCDLQKNVEDDTQPTSVSVTSSSSGSLVQQVDENGGSTSVHASDADQSCKDHTQDALGVNDLESPAEDATTDHPAPLEAEADPLIPEEIASSEEGTSLKSVSDVNEFCHSPSIENDSAKSVNNRLELHSNQENRANPEILLENNYTICLSDIPLPSEEGYQNYLAKRNLARRPELVVTSQSVVSSENSYPRHFSVQVEEDTRITTADKDTQSSDDSFSLSDEEKAFPDPLAPNFDVTRIPLPDECIAIKNRIMKSRNRKRPRELCGNECCTSAESSNFSEANYMGTSVGIQCSKPRDSKNLFSLRSKASQTHKIQIKLKPRHPSLESFHSHNNQTLMEVVEEVSKVLHDVDSGDCMQQVKEKEGFSSLSCPEDRPQACEYVVEPNRSKYCDYPDVGADRIDDCNILEVRCKEVFPVNDCNGLEGRIEEKTATSTAVLHQEEACPQHVLKESIEPSQLCDGEEFQDPTNVTQDGARPSLYGPPEIKNSPAHSLDPHCITNEATTSRCDDAVENNFQASTDILSLSNLPSSNVPVNVSCDVSSNPSTSSFSKKEEENCKSPFLNLNINEICKPIDKKCSEANSSATTADNKEEVPRFEQKTEVSNCSSGHFHEPLLNPLDLDFRETEAKCLDLITKDCHEKWQDFSTVDKSALLNSTEDAPSENNSFITDNPSSKSFDSGQENCNNRNESEVHTCTSKLVVSDTDLEKTEPFENKFENGSNRTLLVETQEFIEEEQKINCDKHERENVPSAREEEYINCGVVADQFVYCENEREETSPVREGEYSFPSNDGLKILPNGEEEGTSDTATGKDNPFPFSHRNIPCNIDEKVPFSSTELSTLDTPCKALDSGSDGAPDANVTFDDVHMAIGKRVYKLSAEWQTMYLGEDDNEQDEAETCISSCQNLAINSEEHAKTLPAPSKNVYEKSLESPSNSNAEFVKLSDMDATIGESMLELVDNDEVEMNELNEDDLPPLDAPGLEVEVANSADSDSDREMPCLEPESDDQVLSNTMHTSSGESHVPNSTSHSVQENIPADLSTMTDVSNVSKNSEEVDESHVTAEEGGASSRASPAVPVFSTLRLSSTTAPRKDMPRVGVKRPHESDDSDSDDSGTDDDDDNCSSGSDADGRQERPRGKRMHSEETDDAGLSRAPEDRQHGVEESVQVGSKEAVAEAPLEEWSVAVEDTPGLPEPVGDVVAVAEALEEVSEAVEQVSEALEEMSEAMEVSEALEEAPVAVEEVSETLEVSEALEEVPETVEEIPEVEVSGSVPGVGVDCIEISDIRTDPTEWVKDADVAVDVAVPEDSTWRCVEVISTEESVREEVVETVVEAEVQDDDDQEVGEPRPRLKCSLSWDRVLLAGEAFVLEPAKVGVRLEHEEAAGEASPWNVVDHVVDRDAESAASAHEENNNHLPKSPPSSSMFKVTKLILERPAPPASPGLSAPCTSHPDSRSPDGGHSLKTKGALKSYHSDDSLASLASQGSRRRRESRQEKSRHRHGKRRWYSHLSPAAPMARSSRSPGAGVDGEVPKVIIKRQSSTSPAWQLLHGRPRMAKSPVVVLERDPRIDAMALRAAARLRRLDRKEQRVSEPGSPRDSHAPSRGSSQRGSSEPRARRQSPPARKRSRSMREHGLREHGLREHGLREHGLRHGALAEDDDDEAGKTKRRKKSSSSSGHDEDRKDRGRGRHRSRDKDKDRERKAVAKAKGGQGQSAAHMHINELVKRWQMTPPGKDTPMPMPSPDPATPPPASDASQSPQYGWHQVHQMEGGFPTDDATPEAETEAEAALEPSRSHWSQLLDAPFVAVSGDAPPPLQTPAEAAAAYGDAYVCEACGKALSGEPSPARADHIKQHPYHCQRCYQAFASQSDFTQHLKVAHPNTQELHHCLLCLRTFPNERQHAIHMKGQSHCHMERSQRRTIHTLFRMFTGSDCPRLSPLTPEDMHALDWLPNDSGVIHFYHQATPLQIATEDWHLHHGIASIKSVKKDTPNPD